MSMLNSRNYDEKRDFIRMRVDTEIVLSLDNNNEISGLCLDLSGTGMLIETDQALEEGSTCKTTLASHNNAFPSLNATIKVLRCSQIEENKYHIGTEIIQIEN